MSPGSRKIEKSTIFSPQAGNPEYSYCLGGDSGVIFPRSKQLSSGVPSGFSPVKDAVWRSLQGVVSINDRFHGGTSGIFGPPQELRTYTYMETNSEGWSRSHCQTRESYHLWKGHPINDQNQGEMHLKGSTNWIKLLPGSIKIEKSRFFDPPIEIGPILQSKPQKEGGFSGNSDFYHRNRCLEPNLAYFDCRTL